MVRDRGPHASNNGTNCLRAAVPSICGRLMIEHFSIATSPNCAIKAGKIEASLESAGWIRSSSEGAQGRSFGRPFLQDNSFVARMAHRTRAG